MTGYANCMTAMRCKPIGCRVVLRAIRPTEMIRVSSIAYADAVVPEGNIISLPLITDMNFLCGRDDFIEVAYDRVALSLGDPDNAGDESGVEEQ